MTEYDFSPEALENYARKQRTISQWVQKTKQGPMRDPFTPATPASNPYPLENSDRPLDYPRTHHRGLSYDRHPDRDRDRHGDRERGVYDDKHKDKARSLHHSSRPPRARRHRSSSQATTLQSIPPPLPLPPYPWQMPYSQNPSPMPQYHPPKLTSPRDSRRSSHSSSTTRLHSPNSYFPPQPSPPTGKYPADTKHRYNTRPVREGRVPDFTVGLSHIVHNLFSFLSSECATVSSLSIPSPATAYPL